ncbi:MAG: lactonase family protein [Planctomycetia bacterium]|nr:lactonase family protein [Planctomycetia bacterium]
MKNILLALSVLLGIFSGSLIIQAQENQTMKKNAYWCYIGTYTNDLNEEMQSLGAKKTEGIMVASYDPDSGSLGMPRLVAKISNPTYFAISADEKFLYAVEEGSPDKGTANVAAYRIDPQTGDLAFLNKKETGGRAPCHLSVDPFLGKYLGAANYGGGDFVFYRLNEDGSIGEQTDRIQKKEEGKDPRGHSVVWSSIPSDDALKVYLADLGSDKIHVGSIDKKSGKFTADPHVPFLAAPDGEGPRHSVVCPVKGGEYVVFNNELGSTVQAFFLDGSSAKSCGSVSSVPKEFLGKTTCRKNLVDGEKYTLYNSTAEIVFLPKSEKIYVSNRGHDSIAVYDFPSRTAEPGKAALTIRQFIPTEGKMPRFIGLDPECRFMIACNQSSGSVFTYRIEEDGSLVKTKNPVWCIGWPVALQFVKR